MIQANVSVVICTLDRPDRLARCLRSLTGSSPRPLEVVVVDQGDEQKTAETIEAINHDRFNTKHIHLPTRGHTRARNAGIAECEGDIVAFTDDDCTVAPGWIGAISSAFEDPKVSCVCGRTEPAERRGRPATACLSTIALRRRRLLDGKRNPVLIGRGNNMAFRRSELLRLAGFNEQIGVGTAFYAADDMDLFYRLLEAGGTIAQEPDAVVFHSQPPAWDVVIEKKRGYAMSTSAVLADRAARGDLFAAGLIAGKLLYEFGYLFLGSVIRGNTELASVGWHSCLGTLSGIPKFRDKAFREESRRLGRLSRS